MFIRYSKNYTSANGNDMPHGKNVAGAFRVDRMKLLFSYNVKVCVSVPENGYSGSAFGSFSSEHQRYRARTVVSRYFFPLLFSRCAGTHFSCCHLADACGATTRPVGADGASPAARAGGCYERACKAEWPITWHERFYFYCYRYHYFLRSSDRFRLRCRTRKYRSGRPAFSLVVFFIYFVF